MLIRLTDNVIVQDDTGDAGRRVAWNPASAACGADPGLLSHVVQFYRTEGDSKRVQELTAASMLRAKTRATASVQLLAAPLHGEADCVPMGFESTEPLRRTIVDLHKFAILRRLPLLFDILDHGATAAKPDGYLIFTNSDICLSADFYDSVRALLNAGFDALIINRRTVGKLDEYGDKPDLAAFDVGAKHPGLDCLVFPTAWMAKFFKTESCVGVGGVMRPLLYNMVAHAARLLFAKAMHLTYHYGDDVTWGSSAFDEYTRHNRAQMANSLEAISRNPQQFEKLYPFCLAHGEIVRTETPASALSLGPK